MRGIFLKIFLSFWLTQTIFVVLALLSAEHPSPQQMARWQTFAGTSLKLYGQNAVGMLEHGNKSQLDSYFAGLERTADMHLYLFSSGGQQVPGRAVSGKVRQLAAAVGQSGQPYFASDLTASYASEQLTGSNGTYVIVAEMLHGRGPLGVRRSWREMIWRLLLGVVVSGFVCYWLARYLLGPIIQLRTATHQISSGNLNARALESKRHDEMSELVHDFNQMASRLESLIKAQRQLIRDMSHELRSPLTRLNLALGLARQRSGQEAARALDRIELEAERLNEMINKLLMLARLENEDTTPESSQVSLGELLKDIVTDADFEAHSRNCNVKLTIVEDCSALANPAILRSAVENVVRNAMRYTADGTDVEMSLECQASGGEEYAIIRVRDHGPGVPADELENLFRPFYRLDDSRERQTGGAGLGLAIADRAVRHHGGSVSATNAPSGGLVVEIQLPATSPARVAADATAHPDLVKHGSAVSHHSKD